MVPEIPSVRKRVGTGTQIKSSLFCFTSPHPIAAQLMCVRGASVFTTAVHLAVLYEVESQGNLGTRERLRPAW